MSNPKKRKATEPLDKGKVEEIIHKLPKILSGSEKLQQHLTKFFQGQDPREPLPGLVELDLVYSNVSKADLLNAVHLCVLLLCSGAENSMLRNEDVGTAGALIAKWEKCVDKDSPHTTQILQDRSAEEVREMLKAVFTDMDACLEMVAGHPVIRSGALHLLPGKDWY